MQKPPAQAGMVAPKATRQEPKAAIGPAGALAPRRPTFGARAPGSVSVEQAMFLQRTIGNQATMRYLNRPQAPSPGTASPPLPLQEELDVGPAGDALEQEADRVADRIGRPHGEPDLPQGMASGGRRAPAIVHEALRSPGQKLDEAARAFMEPRFGRSFADVRVHTGGAAAGSARALGALAYTVGNRIVFAAGQLAPDSPSGRRLLAHELTHVVQQTGGRSPVRVQAQRAPGTSPAKPKPVRFWVKLSHAMDPDTLLREFVRQYYHEVDEREIDKKLIVWNWSSAPRAATAADAAKGGLFLVVTDFAQQRVAAMTPEQQKELNDQTDERFWAETGYKPHQKLGNSPGDKEMARKWLGVRSDILIEQDARRQIDDLPPDIKAILLAGDRVPTPDEYPAVLRLAARLDQLTPEQRRDYQSKVNAASDSFADMDASIDRYLLALRVRENEEEKTEVAAAKLFNKEALYALYRAKIAAWNRSAAASQRGGYSPPLLKAAQEADRAFAQALNDQGFKSEQEFLDAIEAYRVRFREEAVHIAMEILARYDHKLYEERVKLQDPAKVAAIVAGIGATKAVEHYKASKDRFADASIAQLGIDPMDKAGNAPIRRMISQSKAEGTALHAQAENEVVEGSGKDPLVDPNSLGRATDREKLATLDTAEAQRYLLQVVEERQADTAKARAEFTEDPERIFSIPQLVEATMQSQGIGSDTVYASIVHDHIAETQRAHLFTSIVLGILTLILAVLVPGGGWVAAAALVGSATISAAQAYEAVKEYNENETAYRLNFIEEEPSLFWVGVAIAGAALDLGMAASAVFKMSAVALKELETPLKEFAAATEAETAAAKLDALRDKIAKVEGLEPKVREALQAQLDAQAAFKATMRSLGNANVMTPTGLAIKYFEVIYRAVRKGASSITKLRKEAELAELMSGAARLEGAGKQELETVFKQVKKVVTIGDSKKMDEATLLHYVDRLAEERGGGEGAFQAITEEMSAWRKPTADQIRAEKSLTEARDQLFSLKKLRDDTEAELRAGPKTPDGKPDQERIRDLKDELDGLVEEKVDPASGRTAPAKGRLIKQAEANVFAAEAAAERAKVDPKTIMRQAFDRSDEKAAVTEVLAGLKTKPTTPSVDHIVSIKRISGMEGFGKLTVKERNSLATLEKNLVIMDKSANSSKGERSWRDWAQYSTFYDDTTKTGMVGREIDIYNDMQKWITETIRKR